MAIITLTPDSVPDRPSALMLCSDMLNDTKTAYTLAAILIVVMVFIVVCCCRIWCTTIADTFSFLP
jgi:hypothetical protein